MKFYKSFKTQCVSELPGEYQLILSQAFDYIYGTTVIEPLKETFMALIPWLSLYSNNQKMGAPRQSSIEGGKLYADHVNI